jgi:hypothetical protein
VGDVSSFRPSHFSIGSVVDSGSDEPDGSAVIIDDSVGFGDTTLGTLGPLLAAGVRPSDLASGFEDAHLVTLYYLFRVYAATSSINAYDGENAVEAWMDGVQRTERHVRGIHLLAASQKSWGLLMELVEDSLVATLYRLAKGERAQALFTDVRKDTALSRFLVPIRPQKPVVVPTDDTKDDAGSAKSDGGDDTAESDAGEHTDSDAEDAAATADASGKKKPSGKASKKAKKAGGKKGGKSASAKSKKAGGVADDGLDEDDAADKEAEASAGGAGAGNPFGDEWGLSDEERKFRAVQRIHEQLAQLVPDEELRTGVIRATHLAGEAVYGLFSHFAPSAPLMPATGMETLVIECKLVESGVVSRGTGLQLARQHGKEAAGEGLQPMEFLVALLHLSEMATPSLLGRAKAVLKTYATPAARFDFFITQYIQSKIRLTAADAVRRLLQDGGVRAAMAAYNKVLVTLFGSVAGAIAARAAAATGRMAAPVDDLEELTLQLHDWMKLVKDLDFVDSLTPAKLVELIFVNSQDSFDATGDADMSYDEFQEAMVALALARVPNPYMTVEVRLHVFFAERLVPQVRRKFPAVFLRIGTL